MFKLKTLYDVVGAAIVTVLAYFTEIKGSINVMWLAMLLDLWVGIRKSRRIDNVRFDGKKFKYWLEFVAVSTAVVLLIYATEEEMLWGDPIFFNGFTLIIFGFTLNSIIRNAELLTGKFVFTAMLDFINKKIYHYTGIDLKKYDKKR